MLDRGTPFAEVKDERPFECAATAAFYGSFARTRKYPIEGQPRRSALKAAIEEETHLGKLFGRQKLQPAVVGEIEEPLADQEIQILP